jgi:peptide-methionine (S)-S-oxide reductase
MADRPISRGFKSRHQIEENQKLRLPPGQPSPRIVRTETYEQQGSDFGPSYRSAIFYTDEQQKETALATIAEIETSGLWPGPVVTEVNPEERFWQAEPEHQDYLQRHPGGYSCHFIRPSWQLPSARSFPKPRTAEGPQN